jgi:hypothetical protein
LLSANDFFVFDFEALGDVGNACSLFDGEIGDRVLGGEGRSR